MIDEEGLVERAAAIGETIRARMLAWQERFDEIGDVRGLGAMLAIELVHDRESKEPAPELASAVVRRGAPSAACCCSARASTRTASACSCRSMIADAELDEALGVWEQALEHVLTGA